uniref:Uncharacterized protein n=1 Tax=Eutreptiella gymnastica TaxID=73025 RepID=A0A7S1J5E3_9EUGL
MIAGEFPRNRKSACLVLFCDTQTCKSMSARGERQDGKSMAEKKPHRDKKDEQTSALLSNCSCISNIIPDATRMNTIWKTATITGKQTIDGDLWLACPQRPQCDGSLGELWRDVSGV